MRVVFLWEWRDVPVSMPRWTTPETKLHFVVYITFERASRRCIGLGVRGRREGGWCAHGWGGVSFSRWSSLSA